MIINGESKKAYGPEYVAALARSSAADAVRNADSYRWFATAAYLDAFDWSRTIGAKVVASSIKGRSSHSHSGEDGGHGRGAEAWHVLRTPTSAVGLG